MHPSSPINSRRYIGACLDAVLGQNGRPFQVVVVDNASTDSTREILAGFGGRIRVIYNDHNVGFAEAQNQAIRSSRADWVLTLNPDVLLDEDFLAAPGGGRRDRSRGGNGLRQTAFDRARFQAVRATAHRFHGHLLHSRNAPFRPRVARTGRWPVRPDGVRLRRQRGGGAVPAGDDRRRLDGGDFFDPDFFAYREDADVAWRAQLLGWRLFTRRRRSPTTCAA